MQQLDGRLILAASDLVSFLECGHLTHLDLEVAAGRLRLEETRTDAADLVARKGEEHERAYLESLRAAGKEVVEVDRGAGLEGLERAAAHTRDALRSGAEVVYQAVLFDGRWHGVADFLERVPRPSGLGDFSYEVADTKLARRVKPYFVVQLCLYSELLERLQGTAPEWMHVVLGTRERESLRLAEFTAYYRRVRSRFAGAVEAGAPGTYPDPVEHCGLCRWSEHCDGRRIDDDHLSLVAGITRTQVARLNEAGITTVAELAGAGPAARPPKIGEPAYERLRLQARLQVAQRSTGELRYELLEPEEGRGFARLPEPSEGDLFFDIEGDPFFEGGLEYLFGVAWLEDGRPRFRPFWGRDRAREKHAFEQLVDFVRERLDRFPDLHVYHYAPYEANALKRLMGMHATREQEVDDLLRGRILVDLYAIVRQGIRISQPGYSLKKVEAFYRAGRDTSITDGGDSIIKFEEWLDCGRDHLLEEIERYNEDDCRSTYLLREWLLDRRREAGERFRMDVPSLEEPRSPEKSAKVAQVDAQLAGLREGLSEGVPEDRAERTVEQQARWLLVHLLDYHRREANPLWWQYFARRGMSDEELCERDSEAIGGLREVGVEPREDGQSFVYTLGFPAQDHKLGPGAAVDRDTEARVNVVTLDDAAGRLEIRRDKRRHDEPLPAALLPRGPYNTDAQRAALRRLATSVIDGGLRGPGPYRALRDLLPGERPRVRGRTAGAPLYQGSATIEDMGAVVSSLAESCLFVQGPPGSGKTYRAGRLIVELLRQGKRIGVAATSHKAIHNLLDEVESCAQELGVAFRGLKKSSAGESRFESKLEVALVENSRDNADFPPPRGVELVAGTAWLFAREEMDRALDYLFVDEAGQVSLADALAMGMAASNLVVVGDPLQLAQVSQGAHPDGTGLSVREHLLGDRRTVPPDRGVFLGQTRRMHPDVCRFVSDVVYEGRLESIADCGRQSIASRGLSGTGVRHLPVEHLGNMRRSTEEAEAIAAEIELLQGGRYARADGTTRDLRLDDVMVVTPYNAQVRCLRECLPDAVRVGTVDKFQGQEAAIVFFSMATSSGDELPRNLEFLFSRNRLNVAVSRARCLAVLVASPELLHIRCRNAEQMRLVNALCRLVEIAGS